MWTQGCRAGKQSLCSAASKIGGLAVMRAGCRLLKTALRAQGLGCAPRSSSVEYRSPPFAGDEAEL